jgi:BirA family transcriptional regulator, biotin operon repressor / biotin---[acetyl-CoA-carboxylase] ligase
MASLPGAERWDGTAVALATRRIGRPLWHYASVSSTMPLAHDLAGSGASDGTAILADEQTAGRGRRGRSWEAPAGSAILCSLILRPPLPPQELFLLTAAVSVGLCCGVERATGQRPQVKWPNDLVLAGGKLAGILTESRFLGSRLAYVVVGFGMNVAIRPDALSPGRPGALPPISLAAVLGNAPERLDVLVAILAAIDDAYELLWSGCGDALWSDWRSRLAGVGEAIRVETEAGPLVGTFADVARDGALLLATAHGTERILVGDVVLGPRPAVQRGDATI